MLNQFAMQIALLVQTLCVRQSQNNLHFDEIGKREMGEIVLAMQFKRKET